MNAQEEAIIAEWRRLVKLYGSSAGAAHALTCYDGSLDPRFEVSFMSVPIRILDDLLTP